MRNRELHIIILQITAAGAFFGAFAVGCSTVKSILATDNAKNDGSRPISSPFGEMYSAQQGQDGKPGQAAQSAMILRTRKGDRSIEVELPRIDQQSTDFVIPISPAFRDQGRDPASASGSEASVDDSYKDRAPTMADREITGTFPHGLAEDADRRKDIEQGLGLVPSDDEVPSQSKSYLASIDHIKQLYRIGRYEAALLEVDDMIRSYQTDPKLYAMRGTLLDRIGKTDLAVQSWNQALKFDPKNQSLRRFIERKQQRGLAGKP